MFVLILQLVIYVLPQLNCESRTPLVCLNLEGYVRVPLISGTRDNGLYVQGFIGKTKVTFLVDTGATNSFLDLAFAKQLGVTLKPSGSTIHFNGVKIPTQMTEVSDLHLGPVARRGHTRFDVNDMSKNIAFHKEHFGVEYQGIIGENFLKAYSAIIDLRNKSLYMNDPSAWHFSLMQGSWKGVGCESQGTVITDKDYIAAARVKVTGEKFEFEHDGIIYVATLQLDGINSPNRYVLSHIKKNDTSIDESTMIIGLYEVHKNRLTVMMPTKVPAPNRLEELPKSFKTTKENGMTVFIFERARNAEPSKHQQQSPMKK